MCRSSNMNAYALQAPIDAGAIGLHDLTASLSSCTNAIVAATTSSSSAAQPTQNKGRKHSSRHPHIVVEHHYHDHANEHDLVDERPARGGVTTPFPIRLHKMLDKMEADGHGDVISWQPHGRCFVVRKPKEFKELLPIYFKLSKMASFQRQLNLYGFQRLTRGRDKNGYYHEYFLRGRPALSHKIQRTKVKGTGVRARSSPATEPHLWEMLWVGTETDAQAQHYTHHDDDAGSVSTQEDETNDDFGTPKASPAVPIKKQAAVTSVAGAMGSLPAPPAMPTQSASAFMPPLVTPQNAASTVQYNNWGQSSHQQQQPQLYLSSMTSSSSAVQKQQQQQVEQENRMMMAMTQQMRDEISLFGKTFHYLDPRDMAQEAEVRKQQVEACQKQQQMRFPSQEAFMSNLELDNLYSEIDNDRMDNDDAFMDMLERVIE